MNGFDNLLFKTLLLVFKSKLKKNLNNKFEMYDFHLDKKTDLITMIVCYS